MNKSTIEPRSCCFVEDESENIAIDFFYNVFNILTISLSIFVILPLKILYSFYRIGFKRTIKAVKRCNKEAIKVRDQLY